MSKEIYLSLNRFLRDRFGERVQKIPLDASLGCPHRNSDGSGGCIFCDSRGSGTGAGITGSSIREQMEAGITWASRRYKARKYMAYFQSWSNTYGHPEKLRSLYSDALINETVIGLAIGTRPDCVDRKRLDIIAAVAEGRMVWMEYGLQSALDKSLKELNRGHSVMDFINAVKLTREYGFHICAHVIFGIPKETRAEMEKTVDFLLENNIEGVKFHQLFAVRGTPLHKIHKNGDFNPISLEEYADITAWAINRLSPGTVIQRLVGDPPIGELIAPQWSLDKIKVIDEIHARLEALQVKSRSL